MKFEIPSRPTCIHYTQLWQSSGTHTRISEMHILTPVGVHCRMYHSPKRNTIQSTQRASTLNSVVSSVNTAGDRSLTAGLCRLANVAAMRNRRLLLGEE